MLKSNPALLFLGLGFSLVSILLPYLPAPSATLRYQIEEQSQLYLEGTSNVVSFKCWSEEKFGEGELTIHQDAKRNRLNFSGAELCLPVKMLDCGNRGMNKDMYETLQANEHPFINIQLISVKPQHQDALLQAGEWVPYRAQLNIEIAQVIQDVEMPVRAMKLDENRFRFQGEQSIMLTDFRIDPPRPMMGLIKVDDCINIYADLILSLP